LLIFSLYLFYPWHSTLGFRIVMWCRNFWDLAKTRRSPWRHWRPFWTSKLELERNTKHLCLYCNVWICNLVFVWTCNSWPS